MGEGLNTVEEGLNTVGEGLTTVGEDPKQWERG